MPKIEPPLYAAHGSRRETMKAAVLRELSQPMMIEDISIAKPQGREVLVRMEAVGLCHSDLHVMTGDMLFPLPAVLGHEAAGVVEQVGPEVHTVKRYRLPDVSLRSLRAMSRRQQPSLLYARSRAHA
jgi:hypothetical protein